MNPFIILDGGHGYDAAGKRSLDNDNDGHADIMEFEFNDAMVNKISYGLHDKNIPHAIVSNEAYDVPLSVRSGREAELHGWAVLNGYDPIFISIHADAFWSKKANGSTVFYLSRSGERLAKHFSEYLLIPSRGVKRAKFHVLRNTYSPAILIEFGFMTNDNDREKLLSNEWRNRQAGEMVDAILNLNINEGLA